MVKNGVYSLIKDNIGQIPPSNQEAFHGSGARFDKFDTSHMGSGEGVQAHGWGLYFAKDRDTSEGYYNKIGRYPRRKYYLKGKEYDLSEHAKSAPWFVDRAAYPLTDRWFSSDIYEIKDKMELINEVERNLTVANNTLECVKKRYDFLQSLANLLKENPEMPWEEFERIYKERNQQLNDELAYQSDSYKKFYTSGLPLYLYYKNKNSERIDMILTNAERVEYNMDVGKEIKSYLQNLLDIVSDPEFEIKDNDTGQLYRVEIPDDDVLLDEQKPFNKQPQKVKDALRQIEKEKNISLKGKFGAGIYFELKRSCGGAKEASLYLLDHGIKGITYDGRQDGRCYVVFDGADAQIQETYY